MYQISKGRPVVAIAMLSHDDKSKRGKTIVVHKDIVINNRDDFKGKRLISHRRGMGGRNFLKRVHE